MNNIYGHQPVADVIETVRFIGHRLSVYSGLDQHRQPCGGSEQQVNHPSRNWTIKHMSFQINNTNHEPPSVVRNDTSATPSSVKHPAPTASLGDCS